MADIWSTISANYKAQGAVVPSRTKYVAVDPALYEGHWTGTYADKKKFTLTVSGVSGFRAQVKYESGGTIKSSSVLIKDASFRIGDTKFTWAKPGTALVKTVVTDPATGSTYLDTAAATQS
ncbi:MAG: hypothetical protein QOH67_5033 [Hyphomicrobiales bacterium]|jgi:hypothetical protein|nr:hypothetical protein [Hyphomicrobiales bacterium]